MKKFKGFFLLLLTALLMQCAGQSETQSALSKLLPSENELAGWKPLFEPQTAEGEDLYLLINGGAEIYHEYGFKRAIIQSYENPNGKSINLEIYEMESSESAYGVYTFKTGEKGKRVAIGREALLEDYFLNFWKGSCVVTLIGFGSDDETIQGLMAMAKTIDSKLEDAGKRPALVECLLEDNLEPHRITYLRGNLALFNRYEFDTENIFGLREGVLGDYGSHKIFVLHYSDESECLHWCENAVNRLQSNPKFSGGKHEKNVFSSADDKGRHIRIEPYRNNIIIVLGADPTHAAAILEKQKMKIDRMSKNAG
ncbi:MAG: DUF6599 family protein [bacterium]